MPEDIKPREEKNPADSAATQLQETFAKEWQGKLKEQAKKTLDALKIFKNEQAAYRALRDDYEREKADLKSSLKDIL